MPGSENFSGPVYISQVVARDNSLNCPIMSNVTFEPGVINNWHTHGGGQVLIVTGGIGYHQMEGEPAEILYPGDVAMCPPGGTHWHGAVADSWFSHIAIGANPGTPGMEWLDRITDEEYANLPAPQYGDSFAAGTTAQSGRIIRAEEMYKEVFGDAEFPLDSTNPDYADIMNHFIYGDFYTRGALDFKERELLTMCILANMGVQQFGGHVRGAFNAGYSKDEIIAAVTQCMPYMGVPRTLSAISTVNQTLPDETENATPGGTTNQTS